MRTNQPEPPWRISYLGGPSGNNTSPPRPALSTKHTLCPTNRDLSPTLHDACCPVKEQQFPNATPTVRYLRPEPDAAAAGAAAAAAAARGFAALAPTTVAAAAADPAACPLLRATDEAPPPPAACCSAFVAPSSVLIVAASALLEKEHRSRVKPGCWRPNLRGGVRGGGTAHGACLCGCVRVVQVADGLRKDRGWAPETHQPVPTVSTV